MNYISAEPTRTGSDARSAWGSGTSGQPTNRLLIALVTVAAFGLYWSSSLSLEAGEATTLFGADAHVYARLAEGKVADRIVRFHPLTAAMAVVWMNVVKPLTIWITPTHLLKALFALVGAVGVWAAMSAFAALIPRRYVILFGIIYATSFAVWYFSSIEESKIVTATLSALYIASYLRLRERWSLRGAVLLTAILLLACLNEIVSGFLIIIPIVDALVQRGWDLRHSSWIAVHGVAGPIALVILEGIVRGGLGGTGAQAEGASHLSMLVFYLTKNYYSVPVLYSFLLNWFFFSIAAPTSTARFWADDYGAYFEPALANYFTSPVSGGLFALLGAIVVASVVPRYRAETARLPASILMALAAYTLLRGVFFIMFNPGEPLLFTPAVALAHMLVISVLFSASCFPAKRMLLVAFAGLLFITNGTFIIGS